MPSRVGVLLFVLSCAMAFAAAPAAAAPPGNVTPPAIDDATPVVGEALHASGDSWDGTQTGVAYQWLRCDSTGTACSDIQDAAGPAYTVGTGDVGHTLLVRATAANADGPTASDSAPTGVVPDVPPRNTALPTITGTPRAGRTLTTKPGSWEGTSLTITRRWRRCDADGVHCADIAGATGTTLVLGAADEGHTIRVRETASNPQRTATAQSAQTALVPDPVRSASPPLIEGSAVVGATLVSSIGDWAGTTPIVLTRRWQRCGPTGCADITGAYSDIYIVQAADLSKSIRLVVHATNDGGAATAASALLGPVTAGAVPPPPAAPAAGASSVLGATALAAAFNAPRNLGLSRALAGGLKVRAECTGPCRLLVRLRPSKAAARKWHVPRTIASGKRTLLAAGAVTIRPRFAKKTRARLRPVKTLPVAVIADARDGAGKLVSRRRFKVTLARPGNTFSMSGPNTGPR